MEFSLAQLNFPIIYSAVKLMSHERFMEQQKYRTVFFVCIFQRDSYARPLLNCKIVV